MNSLQTVWIGLFLPLCVTATHAADMTSPNHTLRGATLGGGGAVGMASELGAGSAFGEVGATIGQGHPIGIGQDDLLTTTLEAGFWPIVANLALLDTDGDGIPDDIDLDDDNDCYSDEVEAQFGSDPLANDFLLGDVNCSGTVSILDLVAVRTAFGLTDADPSWDPRLDVNDSGTISILDLVIVRQNFGDTLPAPAP